MLVILTHYTNMSMLYILANVKSPVDVRDKLKIE